MSDLQVVARGAVVELRIVVVQCCEAFSAIVGRNGETSVSRYDGLLPAGSTSGGGRAAVALADLQVVA